ncbi:hypothetical protein L249_3232 [Ophiocordyceps polyrhachis-furcata BCC 54312]|uniref:Uncharacterized protein n=1 Tax=Ophiocordyceps polyrhachis-furcata BCC 54312 TaxID=1330021 RepID=A0A367LST8_9HYPO|nr:hypothetical protein L249_3232 [Ophiocordyceps polyrhachis-furcata BCC 54312]
MFTDTTVTILICHGRDTRRDFVENDGYADPDLAHQPAREPIAVVGIGLRLPGGINSASRLWSALLDGEDLLSEVPPDRFDKDYFHDSDTRKQGSVRSRRGGFLDDVHAFDAPFFNMFPAEAAVLDPQQRLALEAAYHALEDGGAPLEKVAASRTSCFVGGFAYDHMCMQSESAVRDLAGPHTAAGIIVAALANRVSYTLDLRGPSVSLDTACSSSMVALHLACQSIWSGEADAAMAGGVNALLRPEYTIMLGQAGFLSPDGVCRSFDAKGNGYVRSEGSGMVYLKPLSRAVEDGDRIYGLVRGSLVNSNGHTPEGLTVPSVEAQVALLRDVYRQAAVDPAAVSYVQAHGPGTAIGDPKEARALGSYLGQARGSTTDNSPTAATAPLWISSCKGNLGHLEGAAGIVGFITAVLAAFHGQAPPQASHKEPNPAIDFRSLRLGIPLEAVDLRKGPSQGLVVGINSFGAGGTNSHAIIQEPPRAESRSVPSHDCRVVLISARSSDALQAVARDVSSFIKSHKPKLADVAYSLNTRRTRHSHLAVVPVRDADELCARLDIVARGESSREILSLNKSTTNVIARPRVAFVFSGQGGQWAGMGKALAEQEPVFAESIQAFESLFVKHAGRSLLADVFDPNQAAMLNKTTIVQPAIAMIQIALARTLMSYGLAPHAVVGHSIGELAAAHITGALSLEDTVCMLHLRATIQSKAAGKGGMLATGLSEAEARKLLSDLQLAGNAEIATLTGPKTTTLAGDVPSLETVAKELEKENIFARFVKAEVPYHSRFMDPLRDELLEALGPYRGSDVDGVELYSSVTAAREPGTHLTAEYWWSNARNPVRYAETVQALLASDEPPTLFVEIGPHPVLVSGTRTTADAAGIKGVQVLPSMTRDNDVTALAHILGAAAALCKDDGVQLDAFNGGGGQYMTLPLYPFQRKHYSYEHPRAKRTRLMAGEHPFFGGLSFLSDSSRGILNLRLSVGTAPFLGDHVMDGSAIFPAMGFVETAFLAAEKLVAGGAISNAQGLWLENMTFEHALVLPTTTTGGGSSGGNMKDWPPEVILEVTSAQKDFVMSSRPVTGNNAGQGGGWTACSRGRINNLDTFDRGSFAAGDLSTVRQRLERGTEISGDDFYNSLEAAGYRYGDSFRGVQNVWRLGDETLATVKLPQECETDSGRFRFHPAMLDACAHASSAYWMNGLGIKHMYLPHRLEKALVHDCRGIKHVVVYGHKTYFGDTHFSFDVCVYDVSGRVLALLIGLTSRRVLSTAVGAETEYETVFEEQDKPPYECADIDFKAVLFIGQPDSSSVSLIVKQAFPGAEFLFRLIPADGATFDASKLPLSLDRRTLIVLSPPALDTGSDEALAGGGGGGEEAAVGPGIAIVLSIARRIHAEQAAITFIVLTRGACRTPVDGTVGCNPAAAALEAAARVLANELQQCRVRVVDLPIFSSEQSAAKDDEAQVMRLLSDELRFHGVLWHDTVTALRPDGKRFVRRVVAVDESEALRVAAERVNAVGGEYFLEVDASSRAGGGSKVGDVVVRQQQPQALGRDEVTISVEAAGLCFGDVRNATGMAAGLEGLESADAGLSGFSLGQEVAGTVIELGANVKKLELGQRVMARVARGLCGKVSAHQELVMPVPSGLTAAQAACIPVAYLTAYYALDKLAQLSSGESVLIQAAAGGVGFAAIQIAKLRGARILATAGSPERRKNVKELGAESVFDSRSVALCDSVMAATKGRGVDVVLNCLGGALLAQSAACLAPFGRFIDTGRTSTKGYTKLGQFGDNVSIFVVDMDRLPISKPHIHRRLWSEVFELFEAGKLKPPPVAEYPVSKLSSALRDLLRSNVIGKAAITMHNGDQEWLMAERPTYLELRPDRSYLVTGGSSGLGLQMAKFLADRGARHLLLVSRSGPKTAEDEMILAGIRRKGVAAELVVADVTDAQAVKSVIHDPAHPPVVGIVHSAAVLHDIYAHNSSMDDFWKVFRPKALGAWNLHAAVDDLPLDFFVLISSMSATLSFAGQVSYSSASRYLDGLAHYRQSRGLPALSVNLGLLGTYAGMTRKSTPAHKMVDILSSEGHRTMQLSAVLDALERAMLDGAVSRMPLSIDWGTWLKAHPHLEFDAAFSHLKNTSSRQSSSSSSSSSASKSLLSGLSHGELLDAITSRLRTGLARVVGLEPAQVSAEEKMETYAADSITMTQISGMILREFRVRYAVMKLLTGPTLNEVAAEVAASYDDGQPAAAATDGGLNGPKGSWPTWLPDGIYPVSSMFVRGKPPPRAEGLAKLICFHSMGAGASLFAPFLTDPPAGFDVLAVQLPGRENRSDERHPQDASAVAEEIAGTLQGDDYNLSDRDVIWGHSFGGLVAFLTLRAVRRAWKGAGGEAAARKKKKKKKKLPRLVVTGAIAPCLGYVWQKRDIVLQSLREDFSAEYMLAVSRYVDDADFMRSVTHGMRMDGPMLLSYGYDESEEALDVPITAFAALQDDVVYPDEMDGWRREAGEAEFRLIKVDGDHWFIHRNRRLIRETLEEMVRRD